MVHRHLNHDELTAAAIDDIIARGKRADWAELRDAVLTDRKVWKKVLDISRTRAGIRQLIREASLGTMGIESIFMGTWEYSSSNSISNLLFGVTIAL
jgi:hypothetical protein